MDDSAQADVRLDSNTASASREEAAGPSIEVSARPQDVQRPTIDDAKQLPDLEESVSTHPKTVKLPPKDVQEKHLKDIETAQEDARRRERKEDEVLHIPVVGHTADLASSPSSTVGAYSTSFTPKATNISPDTSPDVESRRERNGDATSSGSSDSAFKEQRDRVLNSQIDAARKAIRGSSPITADAQLRLEEQEAARQEHNAIAGRMPPKDAELTQDAATFVEETKEADREALENGLVSQPPSAAVAPTTSQDKPDDTIAPKQKGDGSRAQPGRLDTDVPDAEQATEATPTNAAQKPTLERMTTRVSSGALRHKSVNEILGGPRPSVQRQNSSGSATSPSKQLATPAQLRGAKPSTSSSLVARRNSMRSQYSDDYVALRGASQDESKDYLLPLFMYQAHQAPRAPSLQDLVTTANKTLSTLNLQATAREQQDYRILKRIYQLQNANRWSFRQMEMCAEPPRPMCHLDQLLADMKWMRADFREERKLKVVVLRNMAHWCSEWIASSREDRKALQVKVKPLPDKVAEKSAHMPESIEEAPDLVPSGPNETDSEFSLEEMATVPLDTGLTSSALGSLGFDQVFLELDDSASSESFLRELPTYKPKMRRPDHLTTRTTLPVSKLLSSKIVSQSQGPPRKRSRFEYEEEDSDPSIEKSKQRESEGPFSGTPTRRSPRLDRPPDQNDLALFMPENKHVRDRLHASHAFRPPSEFGMPSTSFFESRSSSQWRWDEDQRLRSLVKEFSYNWSLISSELDMTSLFTSQSERRTPWECFERWVQLEGLPAEMSKTQYFRTYQARLEAAARTVAAQHAQAQQQQAQTPGLPMQKRRTTQPYRVERRRGARYLAIIDGMRKLARRRESNLHKQQESACSCSSDYSVTNTDSLQTPKLHKCVKRRK